MDSSLEKLVRHSLWANALLVDFLGTEKIDDPVVLKLTSHIALAELAWFHRIESLPMVTDVFTVHALPEIGALFKQNARSYEAAMRSDLTRVVAYTRLTGVAYQSSVADILLHLTTHGFHHRGQIATRLSALGLKPPNVDFISFSRATTL